MKSILPFILAAAAAFAARNLLRAESPAYRWKLGTPVLDLTRPATGDPIRLRDACAVREGGRWHVFCSSLYFTLNELKPGGPDSSPVLLPVSPAYVPQVFFYRPQKLWQFIGQRPDPTGRHPKSAPYLSTNPRIDDPQGWSKPVMLDVPPPKDAVNTVKGMEIFLRHLRRHQGAFSHHLRREALAFGDEARRLSASSTPVGTATWSTVNRCAPAMTSA